MFKVDSTILIEVVRNLEKDLEAINILEKSGGNKVIFPNRKKKIRALIRKIHLNYPLKDFDEWKKRG